VNILHLYQAILYRQDMYLEIIKLY
jgi:hypothetical protein